jgi:autotransporter-associated beta strand protein
VVWPATTADIGSYYCVITNPCSVSPTVSGSATLTLAEPNNLTWVGDAFNVNIWDLATSVEWTPGSGVFNPGDNVTFDDTYTYSSPVTLVGVLTPTAINVNATRDYTLAGVGTIAGSASLVKSGAGSLTLNNNTANGYSNSYAGGTVINAGTVNITNGWFNLGTGRATLAGGTLESWNKGDGSTNLAGGLRNDLYVTANSTWQIDRTGDQCAGLVGALFGNTGTTLNLYNSSTIQNSANRMRFGGVFTNDSAIAVSANSVTTNSPMDIGTYNSTGVQVYNGPISGTNTGFMVSGAGSVYLNGANTYTRDTTNAAGFLAGSGSISSLLGVGPGATLGGGSQAAIGTFTINSNVILNGNVRIRVDKSLTQSNDLVSVSGTITNGGTGTVTVTNIGATTLAAGDRFRIFSGPVSNGAALAVTGGAVGWVNDLATDGSIQVGGVIADYTTNISYSVGGATLSITWPQTHLGWILQSQTNALTTGINPAGTWYDIPSTANVTSSDIPVISANPTVFYRLRHP